MNTASGNQQGSPSPGANLGASSGTVAGDVIDNSGGWLSSIKAFSHPRVVTMLFLGFSAGVPILLIFSSLSLWLGEAGVKKSAVTFFSWAALGYSFKFVWAPLVDKLPLPLMNGWLGRRRSWLLLSQFAVIGSILWMAMTDPASGNASLTAMALAAVALGFSSATQDIVIDAYRIESAGDELQALMSSTYIAGYRIGMLVAGAGALYLAAKFGSTKEAYSYAAWMKTYVAMGGVMLIGVLTTLIIREPSRYRPDESKYTTQDYLKLLLVFVVAVLVFIADFRLIGLSTDGIKASLNELFGNNRLAGFIVETCRLWLSILAAWIAALGMVKTGFANETMIRESYVDPVKDFFKRYGFALALLLLAIVGLYRMSDIVLGAVANLFYQDIGFTKEQIAAVSKTFGLFATLAGGFIGGLIAIRFGVVRVLFLGAFLSAITNLLFVLLAKVGASVPLLYLVIAADNISAGIATAAFIAFLSSLTNISFTAVQYAIFSSLMTLFPKILGGYSGTMVENMGYSSFFIMTALLTIPVLILIPLAGRFLGKYENRSVSAGNAGNNRSDEA